MKLALALAATSLLVGSAAHPRTYAYNSRSAVMGSIQRLQSSSGTWWKLEGRFYACAGPPGEAALWRVTGRVIELDLEGHTVAGTVRRASASEWRIFADPAVGAPRIGLARRVSATRWDVYRWGRLIGYTRGPDGPAVGLALMFC